MASVLLLNKPFMLDLLSELLQLGPVHLGSLHLLSPPNGSVPLLSLSEETSLVLSGVSGLFLLLVVHRLAGVGSTHVTSETLISEFLTAMSALLHSGLSLDV